MNIYKRMFSTCFSMLLFFSLFTFPVYSTSLDLTGGIITRLNPTSLDLQGKTLYPDEVQAYIEYVENNAKIGERATITVEKNGKEYVVPMEIHWDYQPLTKPVMGQSIEISGYIIPPKGCTFSDAVPKKLNHYIEIVPREEFIPDLSGGVVTYVNPFLGRFWRELLEQGEALAYFEETKKIIEDSNEYIEIEKDGKTWRVPLTIQWNYSDINDERLGDYSLIGKIIPPEGCTFAPDVLTQVSIPVKVLKLPEKIPLTERVFSSTKDRPANLFIEINDQHAITTWKKNLQDMVIGCTSKDGNFKAPLILSKLDTQAVNIDIPGIYPVTAYFEIDKTINDRFKDRYLPSEDVLTMPLYIKVNDPETFEVWNTSNGSDMIQLRWLNDHMKKATVIYTFSETELTDDMLNDVQWKTIPLESESNSSLDIYTNTLKQDLHYYFAVIQDGVSSNILHAIYDGSSLQDDYIYHGGDRDGGGGDNNTLPPVSQPAPAPPQDETMNEEPLPQDNIGQSNPNQGHKLTINIPPTRPSLASNNIEQKVKEEDSDTRSIWSGTRLNYASTLKKNVTFVKQGITVQFDSFVLQSLNLSNSDLFSLEVIQNDKNNVQIYIKINGELISGISNMQVTIPYQPQDSQSKFNILHALSNTTIATEFEDDALHFATDKTGLFTIQEETEKPVNAIQDTSIEQDQSSNSYTPIIIIALLLLLPISWILWRRKQ